MPPVSDHYLKYNNNKSEWMDINTGVPQGSVLGPLLFLIYINDIIYASRMFHDVLFADDTSLIGNLKSFGPTPSNKADRDILNSKINTEIQKVQTWLNLNKLSLNVKKQNSLNFVSLIKNQQTIYILK